MPATIEMDDDPVVETPSTTSPATGQTESTTPAAPAAETPTAPQTQPAATGSTETPPGDATAPAPAGEAATTAAPVEYTDLLEYAKGMGVDLSGQFSDSRQAFAALLASHQQQQALAPYQPYVQSYMQHAPQFQQWLAEQQSRQQQAQQPAPIWNPPATREEVQRLVSSYYERDAQGQVKPRADAPLEARRKVDDYQQYVSDWRYKLEHDPMAALAPMIQAEAQKIVQAHLGQYTEQTQAQEMVRRNSDWLYSRDPSGQQIYAQGRPQLSREGRMFQGYVQEAEQLGIRGVANQEKYALKHVHADLLFEKQAPAQKAQAQNQRFLQQNNRKPSVGNAAQQVLPPSKTGLSLMEMLRQGLETEGITDQQVAADLG